MKMNERMRELIECTFVARASNDSIFHAWVPLGIYPWRDTRGHDDGRHEDWKKKLQPGKNQPTSHIIGNGPSAKHAAGVVKLSLELKKLASMPQSLYSRSNSNKLGPWFGKKLIIRIPMKQPGFNGKEGRFFQMKVRLKSEVRISWIKNGMVNNGKRILLPMEEILHHLGCIRLISRRNIPFLCIIERSENCEVHTAPFSLTLLVYLEPLVYADIWYM